MQRKVSMLMLLFSLIGGAIGFVAGEIILGNLEGELPRIVVVGLYCGLLAFFIGLFCLIAEMINPRLSGPSWRQRYVGSSWKLLVPATLIMLFTLGLLLEFVYGLNIGRVKPVKDIVLVIDNSGSMLETDPNDGRYEAAKSLIDIMDNDKRVAVIEFTHEARLIQPFVSVKDAAVKQEVYAKIDKLTATDGGTEIALALQEAMQHIKDQTQAKRGTMVILLSDGFSEMDVNTALADYVQQEIVINTVGMSVSNSEGAVLLQEIANRTNGQYTDVDNVDDLSFVFRHIYDRIGDRTLLTERTGPTQDSSYYMALRIISFILIGTAIGLSLGLIFDNRHLAKSFGIGGSVGGLIAGFVLEFGLSGQSPEDSMIRLLACLILAGIMAIFTWIVPIKENGLLQEGRQRPGHAGVIADGSHNRNKNSSKGF
ncbi:vWA domain-containing protein [Paenibacillus sp. FA6]|uniref:vWA domain-containing protein n=1 Tax=Paenibacillus sp. FA6 TaxID=3413029 RepID=UPI003F65A17E